MTGIHPGKSKGSESEGRRIIPESGPRDWSKETLGLTHSDPVLSPDT